MIPSRILGRPLAITVLVVAGAAACTEEDIVLGTVPTNGSSGNTSAQVGTRCVDSEDCPAIDGERRFCNRHHCGSEAGTCEVFPTTCDDDEHPVCGCNGVSYFNDCLRRAAGIEAAEDDECGSFAATCGSDGESCPIGSICSHLSGFIYNGTKGGCKGSTHGRCWVLPAHCPNEGHSDRYEECDGAGNATSHCVPTCEAIRSGKPYVRAMLCQ